MSGVARAMVFDGPGMPLRPVEVPLPVPGPGEVLVRVEMCTLCGSDLHTYFGRRAGPTPCVLGHEIVGRVEAVSATMPRTRSKSGPLRIGDRIAWSIATHCGQCYFCERQLLQKCEVATKYGHAPFEQAALSGGLATHCLLQDGTWICRVDDLAPKLICPAGCATSTVVAAFDHFRPKYQATVLVYGAGLLGLTATAFATSRSVGQVIVVDPDPTRRTRARQFGATAAVSPTEGTDAVNSLTSGRGADIVLEMSGATDAVEASLDTVRTGGTISWVGSVFNGRTVPVKPERIVRRNIRIVGVHNYHPIDLDAALTFLKESQERFPFADLVSATFPLDRADDAFRAAATGEHVRVAVVP